MVKGHHPFTGILDHEFVGEVVDAPNPGPVGTRVTGQINITCENCARCLSGKSTHCVNRTTLGIHNCNGCFAEFLTRPIKNPHKIPENLTKKAVFTEPLAAALQIHHQPRYSSKSGNLNFY
jgi:threonine dehydrogenase-like Zn-dependent dehydrogenase